MSAATSQARSLWAHPANAPVLPSEMTIRRALGFRDPPDAPYYDHLDGEVVTFENLSRADNDRRDIAGFRLFNRQQCRSSDMLNPILTSQSPMIASLGFSNP